MNTQSTGEASEKVEPGLNRRATLRQMSAEQLRHLGMRQVAYLKYGRRNNLPVFLLYGADGIALMALDTFDQACEAAVEHGLDFVTVH
jgi:hypothetical protein